MSILSVEAFVSFSYFIFAFFLTRPLYTGELFPYHMLEESICHSRGVGSVFLALILFFFFCGKSC